MTITKEIVEDRIEIVNDFKDVQVRTATVLKEDGVEINRSFHRRVIHCCTKDGDTWSNTDISGESSEVQGICNAVWNDDIRTAFKVYHDSIAP